MHAKFTKQEPFESELLTWLYDTMVWGQVIISYLANKKTVSKKRVTSFGAGLFGKL